MLQNDFRENYRFSCVVFSDSSWYVIIIFEPRYEKTCLRGFRGGPIQTREEGLYCLCSESTGADQLRRCMILFLHMQKEIIQMNMFLHEAAYSFLHFHGIFHA